MQFRFHAGLKFDWHDEPFRIIKRLPYSKFVIEELKTGDHRTVKFMTLARALSRNELITLKAKALRATLKAPHMDLREFTPKEQEEAKFRYYAIRPILEYPKGRRPRAAYDKRLEELKSQREFPEYIKYGVSEPSLRLWIHKYEKFDRDIRALVPKHKNKGPKNQTCFPDEVEQIIEEQWETYQLVEEIETERSLIADIHGEIKKQNLLRPAFNQLPIPSYKTIERRVARLEKAQEADAFEGLTDRKKLLRPLELVQMDGTIIDLHLADEDDGEVNGRAYLTVAFDVATRYPLGFHISYEPFSYISTMEALYHAILAKEDTRKTHDTKNEWIACGIPLTIQTDNALAYKGSGKRYEGSGSLQDACIQLGINLNRSPPATPKSNNKVERVMGTNNTKLFHSTVGTSGSHPRHRQDYDGMKKAAIGMTAFVKIFTQYIVDDYAQQPIRTLGKSPHALFQQFLDEGYELNLPNSPEALFHKLCRIETRTIQHYGIEFMRLRYDGENAHRIRHRLAKEKRDFKVRIKFHPGDLGQIYVPNPYFEDDPEGESPYLEIKEVNQQYSKGLTLLEHQHVLDILNKQEMKFDYFALAEVRRKRREIIAAEYEKMAGIRTRKKGAREKKVGEFPALSSLVENAVNKGFSENAAADRMNTDDFFEAVSKMITHQKNQVRHNFNSPHLESEQYPK